MENRLKLELCVSSLTSIVILLCSVWCLTRGHVIAASVLIALVCFYLIWVNIWFWRKVTNPLDELTFLTRRIGAGSYGAKSAATVTNEIGILSNEIDSMSQKIADGDKVRTGFISQISHELRTPLTAIEGWAETISGDPAIQGDSLKGFQIIEDESRRMNGLVRDLMEFSRIEDGRFNLRMEKIDIGAELEDALFTYGKLLKQSGITLHYDSPDEDFPLMEADPDRLEQVFLNVLDNAAKYGGETKKIDVTLTKNEQAAVITIRDYGIGIPPADLPHVKEKYYKVNIKSRGNGIGLAVCNEIIIRHGGTLDIANAEPSGCLVTVTLPFSEK